MKKLAVALLGLLLVAGMIPTLALAHVVQIDPTDNGSGAMKLAPGEFRPAAAFTTLWFGFRPGGTMSKVGLNGLWSFDLDSTATGPWPFQYQNPLGALGPDINTNALAVIGDPGAGTASGSVPSLHWTASAKGRLAMQGWVPSLSEVQLQAFDPDVAACEPDTYLNYGNRGQFWGRTTTHGIVGPSLWCGVDQPQAQDVFPEFEGDEGIQCATNFPGYANLWDQLIWKDIAISAGGTTMTFTYRAEMDVRNEPGNATGGCAGTPPMQHGSYQDRLDVYAGVATAGTPSADADLTDLVVTAIQLSPGGGYTGSDSTIAHTVTTPTLAGGGIGSSARVVFRVRTNRSDSDQTGTVTFNGSSTNAGTAGGAAAIDDIFFSNAAGKTGGVLDGAGADGHNFASRYQFTTDAQGWVAAAKILPLWVHIINVGNNDSNVNGLGYDVTDPENKWADPCGWPGKTTVNCNLLNNAMVGFNPIIEAGHRDHYATNYWPVCCPRGETCQGAVSPDMDLTSDGVNPYGRNGSVFEYDDYAYNPLTDAILYQEFIRFKTLPAQACPNYSSYRWGNTQFYTPTPSCALIDRSESGKHPAASTTHLQLFLSQVSFCWELGTAGSSGTCGSNFSPVFDNMRFGLVDSPVAPALTIDPWEFYQDSYPGDDNPSDQSPPRGTALNYWPMQKRFVATAPVSDLSIRRNSTVYLKTASVATAATIDKQTAVICQNLNKASGPQTSQHDGYYQGDSMNVRCSLSASLTRVDLLFQVIPGPKTDMTDNWFTQWRANTGPFGTGGNNVPSNLGAEVGGSHGASWKWYVWNDARMDTTERSNYDLGATATSTKRSSTTFMTTLHELDPHYASLGINHELPQVNSSTLAWINANSGRFKLEATPIFPSYLFTPGTVINYFFRSCFVNNLTNAQFGLTVPDTTALQSVGGHTFHLRVLPNAWNDNVTYPAGNAFTGEAGKGRACVLFIDHSFGKSLAHFPYTRSMDSLGIVADEFLVEATSSATGSFGGSALDLGPNTPVQNYGSSGPSIQQLSGYNAIFLNTAGINSTPLSDAQVNDPSPDTQLLTAWLNGATSSHHRLLWTSGNNVAQWMDVQRANGSAADAFRARLGISANSTDDNSTLLNYRSITGDVTECPTISGDGGAWALSTQKIGVIFNFCLLNYDMLKPDLGLGAYSAQKWPNASGSSGIQSAAVVYENAPGGAGSRAVTVTNGFDFSRVRNVSCHDSYGRIFQMRTVYYTLGLAGSPAGKFCEHNQAQTAVDPHYGSNYTTTLFQNTPNPFRPSRSTTIRYAVGRSAQVSLNIVDVSGRVVRALVNSKLAPGEYSAHFDGRNSDGRELAAGVYFYRLKVGDYESNKKMLMLK